ncbi:8734_t:CDS:2 [Racocetra persica]|uniref:8734_t:CDS:1 n=1 Tax=Racocetra persica TaxID=160502 RepID=A0ACA9NX78_9GLOM|nr:8734_t:CDS:2 [Racocetra persica]
MPIKIRLEKHQRNLLLQKQSASPNEVSTNEETTNEISTNEAVTNEVSTKQTQTSLFGPNTAANLLNNLLY